MIVGIQNDSRMNVSIALTATRLGAAIANHVKVTSLVKSSEGKLCGANVRDQITGEEWTIKTKCIINATGPFSDSIRSMDNPANKNIVQPSMGVHIVLPDYYRYGYYEIS